MIIGNLIASLRNDAGSDVATKMAPVGMSMGLGGDNSLSTKSGPRVTPESARKIAVAYRCDNLLSDDLAKMPLQTFITKPGGQVERILSNATLKNISYRLEVSPNDQGWMTPFLFKKMIVQWMLRWGNALIWSPPDPTRAKYLLQTDWTYPEFDKQGNLYYHTLFANGSQDDIPAVEILHLMINPHKFGYWGLSVLSFARETLGRQLAAHETQATIFAKGINPAAIAWVPGAPTKETRKKIRDSYEEAIGGAGNAGRLAVMGDDEFTKYEAISYKSTDMQFLETTQATDSDIANFYGVPEYKLNAGKQSYESNAQQDLDYMKSSLDPFAIQIEQAARLKWLSEQEQAYIYFHFNRDVILQTNAKERGEALDRAIQFARMSPNEARAIEDLPGYEGGEKHWMPTNMAPVEGKQQPAVPAPAEGA